MFEYGGAEFKLDISPGELQPKTCNAYYECHFVESSADDAPSARDICTPTSSSTTRITFDPRTGSYSFWTVDRDRFPAGAYVLEISAIAEPTSGAETRTSGEKAISRRRFGFGIADSTDEQQQPRQLQTCTKINVPEIPDVTYFIHDKTLQVDFPRFETEPGSCDNSYTVEYGDASPVIKNSFFYELTIANFSTRYI